MNDFLKSLLDSIAKFAATAGLRILGAILVLIIGTKLIKWCLKLIKKGKKFESFPPNVQTLIVDLVKVALYVLLIVILASVLGIENASIAAAVASAGLAIGLALQGSLSNFAGGIMILIFKPFSIGDFIDDGTHSGTVTDIGIFYTTLETPDNKIVTIPNGTLSNQSVTDYSTKEIRRLDLKFSVAYDSDIDLVKDTLQELADAHELVLKEPSPFVRLGEQGDSALVFYLRVWVKASDYWTVNFDMLEASKKIFDKRGISIPFPQMDVHLDK
ncbi:MAG: mechanosensitive ion channel [Clostridiales bacterium]|nr:mechanosensitive ion channel [Clostridiales bacterium]